MIVGAGIVGLCTAESLLARGFRVTVVERDAALGEGCSCGNGGIIVPSHFVPLAAPGMVRMGLKMLLNKRSPFGIDHIWDLQTLGWLARFALACRTSHVERAAPLLRDMHLASRCAYEDLVDRLGAEVGYARRGLLMLCATAKGLAHEAELYNFAARLGLKGAVLDSAGLAKADGEITFSAKGGVYYEDDAHLTPGVMVRALAERVAGLGGEIRYGESLNGFVNSGGRIASASLTHGSLDADEFVIAAGTWSAQLAHDLGLKMPLIAGKGYGFTVTSPPQKPRVPSILTEARVAVTPMTDGVRFVGTMELGRSTLAPTPARVEGMRMSISNYYPEFTTDRLNAPVWTGLRPCSPDGLPYVGRTKRFDNLIVATGHAMMGLSLGPITGNLVTQIICAERTTVGIELLSPDRYG